MQIEHKKNVHEQSAWKKRTDSLLEGKINVFLSFVHACVLLHVSRWLKMKLFTWLSDCFIYFYPMPEDRANIYKYNQIVGKYMD